MDPRSLGRGDSLAELSFFSYNQGMALSYWIKKEPSKAILPTETVFLHWIEKKKKKTTIWLKLFSLLLISGGIALAGNAIWPMVSYKMVFEKEIRQTNQALIPLQAVMEANRPQLPLQTDVQAIEIEKDPALNLVNWFPQGMPQLPEKNYRVLKYKISIPKLGIKDVLVTIDGHDLSQSLIQYKGTSVPGDLGQPVIFGHSNLPQFYSPQNYKTVFTQLPKLKVGDVILVDYDGVKYTYQVMSLKVVKPDNFTILEQYYNYRGLRLVTCVPPGTTWERLVVEAKLIR